MTDVGTMMTMAHHHHNIDKEGASWRIETSERTMDLEEDEMMIDENLSQCCSDFEEDDDIISSCSSMYSDLVDDGDETNPYCFGSPRRRATRVKFSARITEHMIISRNEYTQDEMEETWWTPKEQEVMTNERLRTAERLEAGLKEKRSSPYRGLEGVASGCYQHVIETRKAYMDVVVGEQKRQWNEIGEKGRLLDWEKVAIRTKEMTKQSADEAFLIALYDENQARVAYLQMAKQTTMNMNKLSSSSTRISKNNWAPVSKMNEENKKATRSRLESTRRTIKEKKAKGLKPYCSRILALMKKH